MPSDSPVNFASIVPATTESQQFPAGSVIFKEGDRGDQMYVLISGKVRLSHGNRTLETVGDGGIFGEMALADPAPRSATAVAETDCTAVPLDARRFQYMVQETPFFALQVMRIMASRLRAMNARDRMADED
ncbi:MAG: cyclic nucleotide-binding domain-containing protein [Pseudomonadota bacterium]